VLLLLLAIGDRDPWVYWDLGFYFLLVAGGVCPVSTSLSVHAALDLMPCSLASTLTLTPGRTRNLDQDMEALRLSRQDNPFLQLLASRESLLDSDDCNDAAILMSNVSVLLDFIFWMSLS
jgi:hypothetical protein